MSANKKEVDFEVNLLPVISILAVCICFLLLTAVWVHVGTIDTTQAIGAESSAGENNPPSLVVQLDKDNSFEFQLKDIGPKSRQFVVKADKGQPNWKRVDSFLISLRKEYPQVKTSVVLTRPYVTYGHTIKIVDALKKAEINDVGISPI